MTPKLIALVNTLPTTAWRWTIRTRDDGRVVLTLLQTTDPWLQKQRVLQEWEAATMPDALDLLATFQRAIGGLGWPATAH